VSEGLGKSLTEENGRTIPLLWPMQSDWGSQPDKTTRSTIRKNEAVRRGPQASAVRKQSYHRQKKNGMPKLTHEEAKRVGPKTQKKKKPPPPREKKRVGYGGGQRTGGRLTVMELGERDFGPNLNHSRIEAALKSGVGLLKRSLRSGEKRARTRRTNPNIEDLNAPIRGMRNTGGTD